MGIIYALKNSVNKTKMMSMKIKINVIRKTVTII